MKETGILYTPENYDKVLAGTKTMTRRLNGLKKVNANPDGWTFEGMNTFGQYLFYDKRDLSAIATPEEEENCAQVITCPYGTVGDWLYVKEGHLPIHNGQTLLYKRDFDPIEAAGIGGLYGGWKSTRFMPKSAARTWLRLTGLRVERVQAISEQDANAEVCSPVVHDDGAVDCGTRKTNFRLLWDSIHGPGAWERNDWVWVLTFRKETR